MGTLLMLAAVIFLALATLFLFGIATVTHPMGWLALGLTCWAAAVLIGGAGPVLERIRQ